METLRKINDELTITGQITSEQLQQIAQVGFKSVLNLRSPEEEGFLSGEQQQAEALGLYYVNVPVIVEAIDDEFISGLIAQINQLPKPTLVHCDNAMRAAALVLMYIATRQGATCQQAFQQAEQFGLFGILKHKKMTSPI